MQVRSASFLAIVFITKLLQIRFGLSSTRGQNQSDVLEEHVQIVFLRNVAVG